MGGVGLFIEENVPEIVGRFTSAVTLELGHRVPALNLTAPLLLQDMARAMRRDRPGPEGWKRAIMLVMSQPEGGVRGLVREFGLLRRALWETLSERGNAVPALERRFVDQMIDEATAEAADRWASLARILSPLVGRHAASSAEVVSPPAPPRSAPSPDPARDPARHSASPMQAAPQRMHATMTTPPPSPGARPPPQAGPSRAPSASRAPHTVPPRAAGATAVARAAPLRSPETAADPRAAPPRPPAGAKGPSAPPPRPPPVAQRWTAGPGDAPRPPPLRPSSAGSQDRPMPPPLPNRRQS